MKRILICASILGMIAAAHAQNPNVTWQTPTTISGPSDVSTAGTFFGSWAPFNGAALSGLTVNGVTFQAFPDLPGAADSFDNGGGNGTFNSPGTSDNNYNNLLTAGAFGNNPTSYTISWNGMIPGDTYQVQFWVNDGRNIGQSRSETLTGGTSTSAALSYGSDGSGPGQYIIGTLVADNTGDETIFMNPLSSGANPSSQFDLLQVRDLTVAPEPSTLALLAVGAGAMLFGRRKSQG
jgi:hypothetical protein